MIVIVLVSSILAAFALLLVPETSDPHQKLSQAAMLFHKRTRPVAAERLIREAIYIFKQNNDQLGLAAAYQIYGFFFRSASIKKWRKTYRESGFFDKSADYDYRLLKSLEYFEKAKAIFMENNNYEGLTNVNYNLGVTYEYMNNVFLACQAYDESLSCYRNNLRQNPQKTGAEASGFSDFEKVVDSCKRRAGCK